MRATVGNGIGYRKGRVDKLAVRAAANSVEEMTINTVHDDA